MEKRNLRLFHIEINMFNYFIVTRFILLKIRNKQEIKLNNQQYVREVIDSPTFKSAFNKSSSENNSEENDQTPLNFIFSDAKKKKKN